MSRIEAAIGTVAIVGGACLAGWLIERYPVTTLTTTSVASIYLTLRKSEQANPGTMDA